MIQVIDGEITKYRLPKVGILKSGESVSGYDELPIETLLSEGWLPLEDIKPSFEEGVEYILPLGYDILFDKVVKKYEVKNLADLPISEEKKMESLMVAMQKLIRVDELTPEELKEIIYVYPAYKEDYFYKVGDIFQFREKLYKVIQEHTSQGDWIPSGVSALYLNMLPDNIIPEWVQPTGAHDAYKIGDKVIYQDKVYESLINGNSWSPTAYPAGWKKMAD